MSDFISFIRRAIFQYDPEPIEIQTAIMAIATALWIGYPLRHPFLSDSPVFVALSAHFPPVWWGFIFTLMACVQVMAMMQKNVTWRCASAMFSALVWVIVSYILYAETYPGPALVLYPVIALSEMWVYIRLGLGITASGGIIKHPRSRPGC